MRIQLNRNYSGPKITELAAGIYDEHDERLNGRAAYLVGIEVAVWVDEPEAAAIVQAVEDKPVKRSKAKVSDGN